MNTAAMFNETVLLLAAALADPTCSDRRRIYLEEETARLRRSLRRLWELRQRPARGEGTPRRAPRVRAGFTDDTMGDGGRVGIPRRAAGFFDNDRAPHFSQARRDQRRRRDAAD